jgi:hypothetical protein
MTVGRNIFAYRRLSKSVSIFLLLFQTIFLSVIVPGHARGVITLSGKIASVSLADFGCPLCREGHKNDPKKAPSQQDRSECAICHLAIRITTSPPVDFRLGELTLLEVVDPPAAEAVPVNVAVSTQFCRGPPAVSI